MGFTSLVDCVGRSAIAGDAAGLPPRAPAAEKGVRYPPDPPAADEIVAVSRAAGDSPDGVGLRGAIVVLW